MVFWLLGMGFGLLGIGFWVFEMGLWLLRMFFGCWEWALGHWGSDLFFCNLAFRNFSSCACGISSHDASSHNACQWAKQLLSSVHMVGVLFFVSQMLVVVARFLVAGNGSRSMRAQVWIQKHVRIQKP